MVILFKSIIRSIFFLVLSLKFLNFTANKVNKMECSDLENDTNKNGTKHRDFSDEQSQQVNSIHLIRSD